MEINRLDLSEARDLIQSGDVAMFRGRSLISWLIQQFGGGPYSHTAMVTKSGSNGTTYVELAEFREFIGSRVVSLHSQLKGQDIDIFRPIKKVELSKVSYEYDGPTAVLFIRDITGQKYSYWKILVFVTQKLPFIRFLVKTYFDKEYDDKMYVCSTAVSEAVSSGYVKKGGEGPEHFDIMPFKPHAYMEPNDIARSAVLEYLFTIKGVDE